jgi:hypothetical protein
LIVASQQKDLPVADWSVLQRPGTLDDLRRVHPLTPAVMNALRVVDSKTLAPLVEGGGGNSDFYPSLDLGAERTRYLKQGADGFAGLAGERFALGRMLEGRRFGVEGVRDTPIGDLPRLQAMETAVRLRDGRFEQASATVLATVERVHAFDRLIASGQPPMEWHVFVGFVADAEAARHGASVGVADSAYFASVGRYIAQHRAPPPVSAAVDFLHGLAAWDFAAASSAAEVLIPLARGGDHWLPPDLLREGTVAARLRRGDAPGARKALDQLAAYSARERGDVRTELLAAWVARAEGVARGSSRPLRR